jgi:3-isopropylmalate/(R)-2-methylmalate dehydratase small subunit
LSSTGRRLRAARILVARNNFGCGSSREHAVWALAQDGFRVLIAPWREEGRQRIPAFADIFRTNAVKNGLLTIELTEAEVETIFACVADHPGLEATVDLKQKTIRLATATPLTIPFDFAENDRQRLLQGLDDIDQTLRYADEIARFEKTHPVWLSDDRAGRLMAANRIAAETIGVDVHFITERSDREDLAV